MEIVINRDELAKWLEGWIISNIQDGKHLESKELEFVLATIKDPDWSLLKKVN